MNFSIGEKEAGNLFYDNDTSPDVIGSNITNQHEASSGRPSFFACQDEQNVSDIVPFSDYSEKVCVSVIDIVGSTSIVSTLGSSKDIRKFYEIFLNRIAIILKKYRANIIKTVGDGIISYFPNTVDITNIQAFENVLECCSAQIEERFAINALLMEQRLPTIRYRISADFGKLQRTRFVGFNSEDLVGSTVNVCSKMNLYAQPNGIVVGNDLYQILRSFKQLNDPYSFKEIDSYKSEEAKFSYPIYSLSKIKQTITAPVKTFNSLHEIRKFVINSVKSSRTPKILLIDDEVDDLFVLEKFLIHAGFDVKSFSSPREALRNYTNEDPYSYDLVISDIRMPEINGFQLYHKLRLINDNVKIIFATCLEIVDEILTLIPELGQEQLIQKPVEKEKFIEIVRKNIS
ncbi:MAG TPA: response regulator [Nitrososphaeraceae archaeon]|nr:response regulator [Nitrososphaeraceae archaeon]